MSGARDNSLKGLKVGSIPQDGHVPTYSSTEDGYVPAPQAGALSAPTANAFGSPDVITAAGGITPSGIQRQIYFIKSDGGAVLVSANPQIAVGTSVGQELILIGTDDTDYITLSNGDGLFLNGPVNLTAGSAILLVWGGTRWVEISRQ